MYTGPYLDHEVARHIADLRKERAAIGFMLQSHSPSRGLMAFQRLAQRLMRVRHWTRSVPLADAHQSIELEQVVSPG